MQDTATIRPPAARMAVALFRAPINLHDAVADLREAGFDNLAIAFSTDAKRGKANGSKKEDRSKKLRVRKQALTGEKHSRAWRVRHGVQADLHHKGADVLAGAGDEILGRIEEGIITRPGRSGMPSGALGVEVDLEKTLRDMGVPQYRIDLMSREIGPTGSLLLVEVGDRSQEAQSILERNCGINRTDTATERPPEDAAEHPGELEFKVLRETVL